MPNRVLIIDDDTELCALMQKCAAQEGLESDVVYTRQYTSLHSANFDNPDLPV